MYIHALVTIVLERAWAALKCDQLPVHSPMVFVSSFKETPSILLKGPSLHYFLSFSHKGK